MTYYELLDILKKNAEEESWVTHLETLPMLDPILSPIDEKILKDHHQCRVFTYTRDVRISLTDASEKSYDGKTRRIEDRSNIPPWSKFTDKTVYYRELCIRYCGSIVAVVPVAMVDGLRIAIPLPTEHDGAYVVPRDYLWITELLTDNLREEIGEQDFVDYLQAHGLQVV